MTGIDLGICRDVHVELPLDLPLQDYKPDHKMAAEFERRFIQFAIDNKTAVIYEVRVSKHDDDYTWTLETFLFADKKEALKLAKEYGENVREYDLRDKAKMPANEFYDLMSRSANVELAMQWHRIINQKTIYLSLKRKWFEMIASGEKKEEYREIKDHYFHQLYNYAEMQNFFGVPPQPYHFDRPQEFNTKLFQKNFDMLVLRNGYRADSPKITLKNPKIRIGQGKPEWGAIPGRKYFVITWDEQQT